MTFSRLDTSGEAFKGKAQKIGLLPSNPTNIFSAESFLLSIKLGRNGRESPHSNFFAFPFDDAVSFARVDFTTLKLAAATDVQFSRQRPTKSTPNGGKVIGERLRNKRPMGRLLLLPLSYRLSIDRSDKRACPLMSVRRKEGREEERKLIDRRSLIRLPPVC